MFQFNLDQLQRMTLAPVDPGPPTEVRKLVCSNPGCKKHFEKEVHRNARAKQYYCSKGCFTAARAIRASVTCAVCSTVVLMKPSEAAKARTCRQPACIAEIKRRTSIRNAEAKRAKEQLA